MLRDYFMKEIELKWILKTYWKGRIVFYLEKEVRVGGRCCCNWRGIGRLEDLSIKIIGHWIANVGQFMESLEWFAI